MPDVILERTDDLMRGREVSGRTALVLLGHGTDLNKNSGGVIYLNAGRIRERGIYDLVEVGFLDQEPEIGGVVDGVEAENVILIPVFIAEGWHTRETIPEDLGLTGEVTTRDDKTIYYGAPVGTHPSMANLIAARARETMAAETRCLRTARHRYATAARRLRDVGGRRARWPRLRAGGGASDSDRRIRAAPRGRRAGGGPRR